MTFYWASWIVSEHDYRPLTFPPNSAVLGWWCTGFDAEERATLCGLIEAEDQDRARAAVLKDWPGCTWRFINERTGQIDSDRFPLSDWMRERIVRKIILAC